MSKYIAIAAILASPLYFVVRAQEPADAGSLIKSAEEAVSHANYDQRGHALCQSRGARRSPARSRPRCCTSAFARWDRATGWPPKDSSSGSSRSTPKGRRPDRP